MFHKSSRKNSIAVYLMENVFDSYLLQVHPKTLEKQPWVWTKKNLKMHQYHTTKVPENVSRARYTHEFAIE